MDMNNVGDIKDKDFIVVDFFCLCGMNDGINIGIYDVVRYNDFNFYFWQKIYYIFCVVIQFGVVFLMVKIFDFSDCYVGNIYFGQCFMDIVQFEGFNNCINFFYVIF